MPRESKKRTIIRSRSFPYYLNRKLDKMEKIESAIGPYTISKCKKILFEREPTLTRKAVVLRLREYEFLAFAKKRPILFTDKLTNYIVVKGFNKANFGSYMRFDDNLGSVFVYEEFDLFNWAIYMESTSKGVADHDLTKMRKILFDVIFHDTIIETVCIDIPIFQNHNYGISQKAIQWFLFDYLRPRLLKFCRLCSATTEIIYEHIDVFDNQCGIKDMVKSKAKEASFYILFRKIMPHEVLNIIMQMSE